MEYIKPKKADKLSVTWRVSSQTKSAVKYYAQYTGYTEHEVVDMVLGQLKDDPNFYEWIKKQRRNKRALAQIFGNSNETDKKEENLG